MKTKRLLKLTSRLALFTMLLVAGLLLRSTSARADIWEPEGLNLPGQWNGWVNPPTNNLALASYTQVSGGLVTKINTGVPRWQTIFSAATSGGNVAPGSYPFVFSSGPSGSPWNNTWKGTTVSMNTLQSYSFNNGADNQITVTEGKWYTMNWKDNGYTNTQAIFMETSGLPVAISTVSFPAAGTVNVPVVVNITTGGSPSSEELFYLVYTTNNWTTSSALPINMNGAAGSVTIPGQSDGTTVKYYVISSTVSGISSNFEMYTIRVNNNNGLNYSYLVGAAPISWANLQNPPTGTIDPGGSLNVSAQVYIAGATGLPTPAAGVQAWIGINGSNTNPDTWTNWIPASYVGAAGSNDEYMAAIGASLAPGTYYYASRFQLGTAAFVYGGYNGGFWNGTSNVSGILTVNGAAPTVTTGSIVSLTGNSAGIEGNVIADGGSAVTARGICWSTSPNPTIADFTTNDGNGTGLFTGYLTPLSAGTTYYARAYATNSTGTGYGTEVQFTTIFLLTFNVDLATCNGFSPSSDSVYIAGGFPGAFWNEPGTNPGFKMTHSGGLLYTLTLSVPAGTYEYKHFRNVSWSGGEWIGGSNRSVTVSANTVINSTWGGEISWANVQWPPSGAIDPGTPYEIYAQAYIPNGITGVTGGAYGLQAWIGYNTDPTNPDSWTNWISAPYLGAAGGNDEFKLDLGSILSTPGTYYYASRFQFGSGSYFYGGFNSGFWDGVTNISGVLTVNEPVTNKTLNLKVFLEGLYIGMGAMNKAQDEFGDHFSGNVADQVTIELHDAVTYSTIVYSVANVNLATDGTISIPTIPSIHSGSYYITIKHRSSIETTTNSPVSFTDPVISYDFSTNASQAFASNMVLKDGVYCIFGGDGNQDGLIDASDMIDTDNLAALFTTGYISTDANGDGLVDATDMILVDNNTSAFVAAALP